MREVDAEAPVIWPSWCYSGTAGGGSDQGGGPVGGLAVRARAPRRRAGPPAHANGAALAVDASATHNNNNNNIGSPLHAAGIKSERLSPHNTPDRSCSRSRSVTPSTCSFPGTPPQGAAERGPSPAHPNPNHVGQMQLGQTGSMGPLGQTGLGQGQSQPPHVLARNYSDFMRNLAAKYNNANPNGSIFGVPRPLSNGLDPLGLKAPALPPPHPAHHAPAPALATAPSLAPGPATPVGGMFAGYSFSHGGPRTVPAFPTMMDMSSTKALLAIARVANAAKEADMSSHFKGVKRSPGHNDSHPLSSPLDLSSAAGTLTSSAKKPRPSPKHESLTESTSPSGWNNYADGRERSPGIESSQCFSLSIKSESRNGSSEGSKYEKAQSQCGSVKSEAASPASSGRKSPGSTGRKSPGSSTGRECGGCCRGEMKRECSASAHSEVAAWSVDDVCKFVESIDICAEYSTMFREQRIDGAGLPLLTEDHLTGLLRMKLGPALKLRALLSSRLGSCAHCRAAPPAPAPAAAGPWKSPAPTSPVLKSERPPSANSEES